MIDTHYFLHWRWPDRPRCDYSSFNLPLQITKTSCLDNRRTYDLIAVILWHFTKIFLRPSRSYYNPPTCRSDHPPFCRLHHPPFCYLYRPLFCRLFIFNRFVLPIVCRVGQPIVRRRDDRSSVALRVSHSTLAFTRHMPRSQVISHDRLLPRKPFATDR